MRVLVIGATGILGRSAVRRLLADGHDVTGLARDNDRAAVIARQGITPVVADLFDPDSLVNAVRGREAVLNLATRIPPLFKGVTGRGWAENDHVRRDGTAALAQAVLADADVQIVVQEGVSFYYADGGDTELTEDSPIDVPSALRSSVDAHENIAGLAGTGRTAVRLRIAMLYDNDPLTRSVLRAARFGMPLIYGDRNGWTTAVHPTDAASGAVAALSAPTGIYNVGATPMRKHEFGAVLAKEAGIRRARAVPAGMMGMMGSASAFGRSLRVVSAKLTEATGWRPELPIPSAEWFNH